MSTANALSPGAAANADVAFREASTKAWATHRVAPYATDRMHRGVFALAIASYATMMLALWLLFVTDSETVLSLFVCTAYFSMFFGVPVVMYWVARKRPGLQPTPEASLPRFLRGDLETITGRLSGWGALSQVLVVPVSLTLGLIAMGVIVKVTI